MTTFPSRFSLPAIVMASLLGLQAMSGSAAAQSPVISATKSDGTPAATKKAPGSTVTYTNVISNTGTGNATSVTFTDPDVAGAVVVPGTLKVSPIAFDDNYTGTIASGIAINTATATGFSVITNDFVGVHNGTTGVLTITAFDATSANGGTVSMTTSGPDIGKFTYTSAAGFAGSDSFTYTISNSSFTNTGTVTVTVSAPGMVYVSATGDDTTGKGTAASPYKTLAKAGTVDGNNDRVFLFAGTYTGGFSMENLEHLTGQGVVGASFDSVVLGFTPGSDSAARPTINGTKPTINIGGGDPAIVLAQDNVVRGVDIVGSAASFAISGTGVNNFQFGNATPGTAAADTTVTSTNAAGGCIVLSGAASGTVNILGQVTATLGRSIDINSRTGGTVSVIGKVTDNGLGINLLNNTGATFNFRSLTLANGANGSFIANNGGTINLTSGESDGINNDGDGSTDEADEANTINNASGGVGVRLNGVNMGASGINFRSITSTGGTEPGIIILGAGSSGFFQVTGDGGGVNNGSGGAISGKTGTTLTTGTPGVYVSGGPNLRLSHMNISNNNYAGIHGNLLNGIVLNRCNITGNGDTYNTNEGGIELLNLSGTLLAGTNPTRFDQCSITNNKNFELLVSNNTGTLPELQLNTSTFSTNNLSTTEIHNHLVSIVGSGTAVMSARVSACTFTGTAVTGNGTSATGLNADTGGGSLTVEVLGSSFTNNNVAVTVSHFAGGNLTFDIHDNTTVHTNRAHGMNYFANVNTTGTVNGKFRNNVVGLAGTAASASQLGNAISLQNESNNTSTDCNILVTGNLLQENGSTLLNLNQGVAAQPATRATNITITNNTFRNSTAGRGIQLLQNNSTAPGITRATISGNTFTGIAGQAGDGTEMRLRHIAGGTFNVQQADHATLASVNGLTTADVLLAGTITFNSAAPPVPPLLFAPGGVDKVADFTTAPLAVVDHAPAAAASVESALPVAAVPAAPAVAPAGQLTQAQLSATVAAAMDRWQASGLSAEQTALLRGLTFEVADLPDLRLGEADGRIIRVDSNAGGTGWYVNGSTGSDAEFSSTSSATRLYTQPTGAPAGRLDLLTALMHEMGHALGLEDSYLAQDRESLMYGFLTMGERRLPAKGQAVGVTPHEHGGSHFLSAPVNIGVLPPGKTVTISYDVTINDPVTVSPLSSQGTVSGGNFSNVLTDDLVTGGDPLLPGAADPTVTLISQPEVTVAVSGSPVAEDSGSAMTYSFSRTGATTAAMTVNFNTSGSGAAPGTDFTVASGTGTVVYNSGTGLGTIVIPIGSSSATLTITPVSDVQVEANETAVVNVATGTGYDVGVPATATGTINNDDTGIQIDPLPDASLFEDQTLNFSYTFRRLGLTTGTTAVNFNVAGTATFNTDYSQSGAFSFTSTAGTVVFNPGETTKVITLDPTNDNLVEGNETINLNIASGVGYIGVNTTSQTATIVDDDVSVTVSVTPSTSVEDVGTGMVYTFNRSGGSVANALTVNVQVSGSADRTTDFSSGGFASFNFGDGSATITFAGGATTKTVTVAPLTDATAEPDETVTMTILPNGTPAVTGGYAVGAPSSTTGTILDDDTQVSVAIAPSSVGESSGTPMVYTFTRTGSTAAALTANYTLGGTASFAALDFGVNATAPNTVNGGATAGTVTFGIGVSQTTISVTPLADAIVEADETVVATVTSGSGYVPAAGPNNVATGTINDDDVATVSIAKISDGSEGPPLVNGKFRITQTAVSSTNTVVNYNPTGTAFPGAGNDYGSLSGTATILAGNTSVDIDVVVNSDAVSEPTETVIVTLTTLGGGTDPQITIGSPNSATVNILSGPVPVASALGDTVTDNGAPSTDGATNIGKYDLLRRSGYLAQNGDLVFSGHLLVDAGPPAVTVNDFQGIWAKDAANPLRLIARSGSIAASTGNAVFDILPEVPAISDGGDVTFLASLRIGSGSTPVTASNDTGIWTTLSVAGANPQPVLAVRESTALASPSNAVITKFATGVYATATGPAGVIVFSGTESDGKTGVYVMTMLNGSPLAAVTTAKQGNTAPGGGGEVWDHLASGFTDPARMDANGNFCWSAKVKPSGKEGIWYAPIATGIAAKVMIAGDAAPGTTTTFSRLLDLPVMGGVNNIAFHAYLAATGDNAANDKGDGIWKGVAPAAISAYTLVIRCGDTGVAGLPGGAKVGNLWSPWMSNANRLAFRGWVDVDGNGTSGNGTDVHGLYTDASGTMTMVIKQGDAAPGMPVGATMVNMDLPVIGGVEQMAFIGTVTGGGTTSANNQGIWRQSANGGALSLVVRTGDSVSTSQGTKVISKLDFPGTTQNGNTTDHRWEQWVMDSTGRMIIQATFVDGTTAQLIAP